MSIACDADHILITGDLTTTALPAEFRAARAALADLAGRPRRVTIIPGNHDRYTLYAHRSRRFERYFGEFAPSGPYAWLRWLDLKRRSWASIQPGRASRPAGRLPPSQLKCAREILAADGPVPGS